MVESDSSVTNLVILTRRHRFSLFCKLYWRYLVIIVTPIVWLPVAFIKNTTEAYTCFYVFLVTATFWVTDAMHPAVACLLPVALSSIMVSVNHGFIGEMYVRNALIDCAGVMILILAIEESQIHKRLALKLLLIFGCFHFRLSFLLFFTCMFLSMWVSSITACGFMMPLVKAVLIELEKMGIIEVYQIIGKARQKSHRHGEKHPRPTDLTVFYFLGIAYSSLIGASATLMGSHTNQIMKIYCESLFPNGPKIEFPRFMLLNLPGTIVMETLLYFWMNFWFLGMFRNVSHNHEVSMTEEEAEYTNTLLTTQYQQMGPIRVYEWTVGTVMVLTLLLQPTVSSAHIENTSYGYNHKVLQSTRNPYSSIMSVCPRLSIDFLCTGRLLFDIHYWVSSPCMMMVVLLFILPQDMDFMKFFKNRSERRDPLPQTPSPTCLKWVLVENRFHWSVLFIVGGSATMFESMKDARMTNQIEQFLLVFKEWPSPALMLVITITFKILTEFAPNSTVVYCLLPHIAKLAVICNINPHYLMMAATLATSFPFHLTMGSPVLAMVAAYVHIPPFKMMSSGTGLSICSVIVTWFTVAAWSAAVWTDVGVQDWSTHIINLGVL